MKKSLVFLLTSLCLIHSCITLAQTPQVVNTNGNGTLLNVGTQSSNLSSSAVQNSPQSFPTISAQPITQTVSSPSSFGGGHTCKTFELNQQHYQDRGILNEFNNSARSSAENVSINGYGAPKTAGVNEISVIFHVVHNPNNPAENVSNALIMQVYNDLVEDFLLNNANAANARTGAPFNFTPANSNINYCLATRDPSGTPLTEVGVVRVATTEEWYDSDNGEENKMKAAATGGSEIWDRNDYLNIWICDISNGANSGTAGYAYRPTPTFLPSAAIDGIVLDYNLGMNNENVLTHEVGHYLGLDHPWGGSGGCGNDDGFADTPVTDGPSFNYPGSCSGAQQTCGAVEVQYENYMDYSNCTVMFTQNQADYMLSILQGIRSSLLLSPGCDPVDAPPVVDFTADIPDPIIIPVGGSVNFFSQATNSPTSWTWDFNGGSPNQTVENPTTVWNTIGTYTVTHTATNAFGTGSETKTNHVQVVPAATGIQCDTLRNYNPADNLFIVTSGNGYIEGNNVIGGEQCIEWAEAYTAPLSTEVRRLEFLPSAVNNGGGSITFKVYGAGATPGAVLATEVVPLANLTAFQINQVDFATPATVTGNFWVGYEVSYANVADTFALTATTPGTNFSYVNRATSGWAPASNFFTSNYAFRMDVLTSNGPDPVANLTMSEVEICEGGTVVLNGSGSQNTTDYLWAITDNPVTTIYGTFGGAGQSLVFNTADDYGIILLADGSCKTAQTGQVLTVHPPVTATSSVTHTTCGNNNGVITINGATGGNGTYSYSMDGNNYQTSNVFNNVAAGTYTIYIQTPGSNCEGTLTVTVNPSTPFVATAGPNTVYCAVGTATLTANGGTNYTWYDGSNVIANTQTTTVSPTNTTQYSCLVTDAAGCQSTVYTTVTVYPAATVPTVSASGPVSFCTGGSVDLTSSETTGNVWAPGSQTTQTITVNTAGTYTVTYTDGNNCSATSTPITVTVNPDPTPPTISASGSTTICPGGSVDLTSSETTGNVWTPGSQTTQTISVNTAGNYSVTYTDGNGCSATSNVTTVTVENPVTLALGTVTNPTTCGGLNGSIVVNGTGTGTVSWTGAATGNSGSVTLPYTITGLAAGSYNITFQTANMCPATNTLNQTLSDPANPAAPTINPAGPVTICNGGSQVLTSSYATGNVWSTTDNTQAITVTTAGTYSVTYTDANGCSATSTPVNVTVDAPNVIAAGTVTQPTACAATDGTIQITGTGTGTVSWNGTATGNSGTVTLPYTITGLAAGAYTIDFTNANSCPSNTLNETLTDPVATTPTITASGVLTFCSGGSVDLTSSETTGNVWSPGSQTTQTITVTTSGSYTVTYTDGNGCTSTSTATVVTVNPTPSITQGTVTSPTTCGASDGSIVVNGTGTGNVSWTGTASGIANAVTLPYTITGLAAGSYDITFTSAANCPSNTITVPVIDGTAPATPTINASGPLTFCDGGSVDLTSSYATGNTWAPTGTGQTITVTTSGTYTVTYTDGNGCSSVSSPVVVTVNPAPTTPTITANGPTTFCSGGSVDLTSSATTGNAWSPAGTGQTITVNATGSYTVTITDGNGCTATSAPTVVTVDPTTTLALGTTSGPTTCAGTDGTIQVTGTGTGTVSWTGTATGNSGAITLPYTITGLSAGTYTVDFNSTAGCPANTINATISDPAPPAAPTINASGPITFCDGASVDLTSSYATGNAWTPAGTGQTITVTTSGTYTVTHTDGNGCSSVSTPVTVTVNPTPAIPTITASGPTTFCTGGSVDLSSSATTGNTWSPAGTGQTISVNTTGSYTVTVTDGNGCTATSAPTVVTVEPTTTLVLGTTSGPTTCTGTDGTIEITGTGTGTVTWNGAAIGNSGTVTLPYTITGIPAGAYTIDFNSTAGCPANTINTTISDPAPPAQPVINASGPITFCAGGSVDLTSSYATGNTWSPAGTTQTITATNPGAYTVTHTDANGCSSTSAPTIITINALPAAPSITASGPTTFCSGDSVDLVSSEVVGNTWSTTETTQTITVTTAGTYDVTFTDGNGCTATSTPITITVNASPAAPIINTSGPTAFCSGGSVDLTSSEATGNVWSTTDNTQTITVTTAGTYTVTYTDANGCTATSAPTDVIVNLLPNAPTITAAGPTTFCAGQSVDLTSSEATGNTWSTTEITQTITVTQSGSYDVTFTDANGCTATSLPIVVSADNGPTVSGGADQTVCEGEQVTLNGSGAASYAWDNGVTDNVAFTPPAGINDYVVTGTDGNGCSATDTVTVVVNPAPQVTLTPDLTSTCVDYGPVALVGTPAGGLYLGAHVNGNQFDPTSAGVGTHTVFYESVSPEGCTGTASATIVVDACASIETVGEEEIIVNIYPNPMQHVLNVEVPGEFNLTMVDARGRIVYQDQGTDEVQVQTDFYEAGVYLIYIQGEKVKTTARVIKN